MKYFKLENKENKTFLISSHDINLIEYYCDKLIYLNKGTISYFGNIGEFIEKYKSEEKTTLREIYLSLKEEEEKNEN